MSERISDEILDIYASEYEGGRDNFDLRAKLLKRGIPWGMTATLFRELQSLRRQLREAADHDAALFSAPIDTVELDTDAKAALYGNRRSLYIRSEDVAPAPEVGRWVPWKPGDALPEGRRLVTHIEVNMLGRDMPPQVCEAYPYSGRFLSMESRGLRAIAYWSVPLPPPYDAAQQRGENDNG